MVLRFPLTRRYTPLEAGYYPFRVEYLHPQGAPPLAPIYIKPQGVDDFAITPAMLYGEWP